MNYLLSNLKTDTAPLLDYTPLAEEKTAVKADVKISTAVLELLSQANIPDKEACIVDILGAYQEQLILMNRQKSGLNAQAVALGMLFSAIPTVMVAALDLSADNGYWPTLTIRLAI